MTKRIGLLGAALVLLLSGAARADATALVDRLVARVDDKVILLSDVQEHMGAFEPNVDRHRAEHEALDELIVQILVAKDAAKREVTVTNDEVQSARESVMTQNHLTPQGLAAELQKRGLTAARYDEMLRVQVLLAKWLMAVIGTKTGPERAEDRDAFITREREAAVNKLREAAAIDVRL